MVVEPVGGGLRARRAARFIIDDGKAIGAAVDAVGLAMQRNAVVGPFAPRFDCDGLAVGLPNLRRRPAQRGFDTRQPEGARKPVERRIGGERGQFRFESLARRAAAHPIFEQFMHPRTAPARIGCGTQRIERREAEHAVGVKGEGIACELVDAGNADPARTVGGGRLRRRTTGGLRTARRQVDFGGEARERHAPRRGFGKLARERREPQPEARGDGGIAAAALRAR